jgi:hypothetical protein
MTLEEFENGFTFYGKRCNRYMFPPIISDAKVEIWKNYNTDEEKFIGSECPFYTFGLDFGDYSLQKIWVDSPYKDDYEIYVRRYIDREDDCKNGYLELEIYDLKNSNKDGICGLRRIVTNKTGDREVDRFDDYIKEIPIIWNDGKSEYYSDIFRDCFKELALCKLPTA